MDRTAADLEPFGFGVDAIGESSKALPQAASGRSRSERPDRTPSAVRAADGEREVGGDGGQRQVQAAVPRVVQIGG
ncbi:MAG: hypothetical protein JWM27_2838 [Gemmatimonadetes bacterium]|nr:hypothetical protein [Gemmatimonadota bacterium]